MMQLSEVELGFLRGWPLSNMIHQFTAKHLLALMGNKSYKKIRIAKRAKAYAWIEKERSSELSLM